MRLNDIANKYNTDKALEKHGYVKHYEQWFEPLRNDNIKLLEIGVREGWSHKMWKDYFPNGHIYGVDIDAKCKQLEESRLNIFIGDQGNNNFLDNICNNHGPFDIIIDDGSHMSAHQISSFNFLIQFLKSGGIYVIEDLHTSYWMEYTKGQQSCLNFLKTIVDKVDLKGRMHSCWANASAIVNTDKNLDVYEKNIESIHFYKSMCFLIKR